MPDEDKIEAALHAAEVTAQNIAKHLRLMAAGNYEHQSIMFISPWIRSILNAAADMLEVRDSDKLH